MSEYYIGAIRANGDYLAHYRTKGVKNGEGKYFQNGRPTALGIKVYGPNAGYQVVGRLREMNNYMRQDRHTDNWAARSYQRNPSELRVLRPYTKSAEIAGKTVAARRASEPRPRNTLSNASGVANTLSARDRDRAGKVGYDKGGSTGISNRGTPLSNTTPDSKSPTYAMTNNLTGRVEGDETLAERIGTGVQNIANTVGSWGARAVDDVTRWVGTAGDTVKQWLKGAGQWISGAWNKAMTWCKNAGRTMFNFAKKVVGKASEWGRTAIKSIKKVGNYIGGFVRGIAHRPDAKKGDYRQGSGYEAGYKVRTGAQNIGREIGKAAGSVGSFVTDTYDTLTGKKARKAGGVKTSAGSKENSNRNTVETRDMSPITTPQKRIRDRHRTTDR